VVLQRGRDDAFAGSGWKRHTRHGPQTIWGQRRWLRKFLKSKTGPTLIVVDSHMRTDRRTRRIPTSEWRPLARRKSTVKKKKGGPKMRSFGPRRRYGPVKNGVEARSRGPRGGGRRNSRSTRNSFHSRQNKLNRMQTAPIAGRLGQRLAELRRLSEGMATRESSGKTCTRWRRRRPVVIADRRPGQIQQDEPDVWTARESSTRTVSGRNITSRRGKCHGRDREWHDTDETPGVSARCLFQRYMRRRACAWRTDGNPRDLHFNARLNRRGRRRADAPAIEGNWRDLRRCQTSWFCGRAIANEGCGRLQNHLNMLMGPRPGCRRGRQWHHL